MSEARELLRQRSKEIRVMQRFIIRMENASLGSNDVLGNRLEAAVLNNCIKATFLMMLYNLAEAVVVSTIHEIFEKVEQEKLSYNQVAIEIRSFWIERRALQIRHGSHETYSKLIQEVISSVLAAEGLACFTREDIRKAYLGNVDGKLIRQIATQLDVSFNGRASSRDGVKLLEVKTTRNALGHGVYSFDEVGALKSVSDLRETSIRVRRFLLDAVISYERYMAERKYAAKVEAFAASDLIQTSIASSG